MIYPWKERLASLAWLAEWCRRHSLVSATRQQKASSSAEAGIKTEEVDFYFIILVPSNRCAQHCAGLFITCLFTAAGALSAGFNGEDASILCGFKVACSILTESNGYDCKAWVFIFNCEFSPIEDLRQVWAAHWEISQQPGGTVALLRFCLCARLLFCWNANSPTGALLSDWQVAGERYDGAVRPAVWLSFGSGSPDALRNASECNFPSHPSRISFSHPSQLLLSFFGTVQARKMMMGPHGPRVYKKALWQSVQAQEKETKLFAVKGKK